MKNIKNYYKGYNVAELKEGLVALNLKFCGGMYFWVMYEKQRYTKYIVILLN